MSVLRQKMLVPVFAMGCWTCFAQQTTIPFEKIEKDAQQSATLRPFGNIAEIDLDSNSASLAKTIEPPATYTGFTRMTPPARIRPTLGSNFYLLNGLHLGMAVIDVEITQHCIATHQCREGNPLIPSSQAGALSLNIALVGYGAWISHRMKKNESHIWWVSPTIGIAGHVVGVITGTVHR